ncbi:metallopeptidase family protein [Patescibacteria group bacterium]|nr:metallopeptidase family protein [Patescibacteria group bacterium]
MQKNYFEKLVYQALAALPSTAKKAMDNVEFVIEDEARQKRTDETDIKRNEILLGLYEGIPKTDRDAGYFWALPDKITLFKNPLEELSSGDKKKLKKLINDTIWHEIGHHLGFDEKEIRDLEIKLGK